MNLNLFLYPSMDHLLYESQSKKKKYKGKSSNSIGFIRDSTPVEQNLY